MKKISALEYISIIYFLTRAVFFNIFFNNLLILSKQDSWISILLGIILGIFPIILYYKIKDKEDSLFNKNKKLFTKYYPIINSIIIGTTLLLCCYLLWNMVDFISLNYLYETPSIIISLLFSIAIVYRLSKNFNTLTRSRLILFYISVLTFITTILFLISNIKINNFSPIIYNSSILDGVMYYICYAVLPLFTLTIFSKSDIEKIKIKHSIIYYILTSLVIFFIACTVLGNYGINLSLIMNMPEFHVLKRISFSNGLSRIDTLLAIQCFFDYFIAISFYLYFSIKGIEETFKIKNKNLFSIIILLVLCLIVNMKFMNHVFIKNFALYIFPYILVFGFLVIPLIIFIKNKKNS